MSNAIVRQGEVLLRGTRMDARGLADAERVEGARGSAMDELADRTLAAERVRVFRDRRVGRRPNEPARVERGPSRTGSRV